MGLPGGCGGGERGGAWKWEGKARAGHQWELLTASTASPSPVSENCRPEAGEVEWGLPCSAGVALEVAWVIGTSGSGEGGFSHTHFPSPRNQPHPCLHQRWVWFPLE